MRAMDKKLWRELWAIRGQALAIVFVVVGGVGIFVMSLSTLDSLYGTQKIYYQDYHFAHIFSGLKRAPLSLAKRIAEIPGVDKVQDRVAAQVNLDIAGFDDPVSGKLLSLPIDNLGVLNQLYLRSGRFIDPRREKEVLLSEKFANAHQLRAGDSLHATINGKREKLTVVGIVLSPEHIYQIAPGALFPDPQRYGVLWMARKPLASAYDMDGAFNDLSLTLTRGTNEQDVIDRLDDILKPYGGHGAYPRKDQLSNRFFSEDLKQLGTMATIFPTIFLGVAAFLLNVVISRLVGLQREQIASLKAFGYSSISVAIHYIKLVMVIISMGLLIGVGLGIWLGQGLANIYTAIYSLPFLAYTLEPKIIASAMLVTATVALIGTLHAIAKASRLPPAQAMRPESPPIYRQTMIEQLGVQRWLAQPTRIIIRNIERRPIKALLTSLGIALACSIMMISGFQKDAIDYMVDVDMAMSQREDLVALYTEPTSAQSLYSLRSIEGIEYVEGFRSIPARLRFAHRFYRTSVQGIETDGQLLRLLDSELDSVYLPSDGVILTDYLAEILGIQAGDSLIVEVLEQHRPTIEVPVIGLIKQYMGVNAYIKRETLNRLLKEGNVISGAYLDVTDSQETQVYRELKDMPRVANVIIHDKAIESFYDTIAETILFFTFMFTLLGGVIAFGVVYNSMRIALSERSHELASLRVLGFSRAEVAYILLGELALLILIAIPVGLLIGYGLCAYIAFEFDSDLYRVPLVVEPDAYSRATSVVIVSALLSAAILWRALGKLDMVAVLKTKE